MDGWRRREKNELLDDVGLKVSSICPGLGGRPGINPTSPIAEEREASIEYYKELVDLACDLRCDIVIWAGGRRVYCTEKEQAWEWSRSALTQESGLFFRSTEPDAIALQGYENLTRMLCEM